MRDLISASIAAIKQIFTGQFELHLFHQFDVLHVLLG